MKRSKYCEHQVLGILKEVEGGRAVAGDGKLKIKM